MASSNGSLLILTSSRGLLKSQYVVDVSAVTRTESVVVVILVTEDVGFKLVFLASSNV